MSQLGSWLDKAFHAIKIFIAGNPIPVGPLQVGALNFVNGASAAINPATGNVDVTISGIGLGTAATVSSGQTYTLGPIDAVIIFDTSGGSTATAAMVTPLYVGQRWTFYWYAWGASPVAPTINAPAGLKMVPYSGQGLSGGAGLVTTTTITTPGASYTLVWDGTGFTDGTGFSGGSLLPFPNLGGDLTGSTDAAHVVAISGNGGTGGPVPLNAGAYLRPAADLGSAEGDATHRLSVVNVRGGLNGGTSTTGAGTAQAIVAESAMVGSNAAGGNVSLSGGARDGSSAQFGYVETLVPGVATPLTSVGAATHFGLPPANHSICATQGTNTSQLGTARTVMGYAQTTTNAAHQNVIDIDLAANASHAIHVSYVIRKHGGVGVMAAGEIVACMYTDNTVATIVGSAHTIWSVDGTSGDFAVDPIVIANGSQLKAGVNVSPGSSTTYDYALVAWVTSN